MAVTLGSLCEKASYLYSMRVIAGREGLSNIVQWVHTVEDAEVSGFLHGGELVFSTGIANQNENWLLPFVKNLIANQVSGLVLNIGPYIKSIPQEVVDYCNAMKFPLMDIPWKTRIVDISRDFCNRIILNEKEEEDIGTVLRNLVFFPSDSEKYMPVLESHNFDVNADYCMISVKMEIKDKMPVEKSETIIERILCSFKKHWGGFKVDLTFYYVLCNFTQAEIEKTVSCIQAMQYNNQLNGRAYVTVGLEKSRLSSISKSYQISSRLMSESVKKNVSPLYYEKLGIKKLILAVDDTDILQSMYDNTLKPLEVYDRNNGTDYMGFLKKYLEYDGSVQRVAEETFVHRNTINYQLAKVKKIINNDMKTLNDRFKLILAFNIKDII